jgi:hypothetical protein
MPRCQAICAAIAHFGGKQGQVTAKEVADARSCVLRARRRDACLL